ncbi:MAG: transcriptional regulator [Vicinamibacteria bacterium]|jgi:ligand-binding sensor domain-containing protein|nr:transcriptional regulator [Vicinamibacteria bacterium]
MRKIRIIAIGLGALLACGTYSLYERVARPRPLPQGWQVIRPPDDVFALAVDGSALWAGGRDGVFSIDRATGRVLGRLVAPAPLLYVRALLREPGQGLWIGHQAGLTLYDGASFRTYTARDGLPNAAITSLLIDRRGRLWVGTFAGAAVREGAGYRILTERDGLLDRMVNVMLEDRRGGIWLGSYTAPKGGLTWIDDERRATFSTQSGLPHNNINALVVIDESTIWAATGFYDRGGAAELKFEGGHWRVARTYNKKDGLAGDKARSLFQGRDGTLWCGSEYDGIAYRRGGAWRVLTEQDSLSNNEVRALAQDPEGTLWLGTRSGLTRLSAEAQARLVRESTSSWP